MKSMANLIRVQKWKLDEQRRVVTDLEDMVANYFHQLKLLDEEMQHEQQVASENTEVGYNYANYVEAAKMRRQNLETTIAEFEGRLEEAQDVMAELFQDLKKYEISEETRLRRMKERIDKEQQQEMDDFSIESFRRKSQN